MKPILLSLALLTVIVGCASSGRKLDQSKVDQIRKGETTQTQVVKLVGSPDQITKDGDGNVTFTYMFVRATAKGANFVPVVNMFAGGVNMQSQSLIVTFGPDGVCNGLQSTQGGSDISTGLSSGSSANLPEVKDGKRPK